MNKKQGINVLLLLAITACGAGKEGKVEIQSSVTGLNPELSVDVQFINTQTGNSVYSQSLSVANSSSDENRVSLPLGQFKFLVERIPEGYQCTSELSDGDIENEKKFNVVCNDDAIVSFSGGITLTGADVSGLQARVISPFSGSLEQTYPDMVVSVLENSVVAVDDSTAHITDYNSLDVQLLDESGTSDDLVSDGSGNLTIAYDSRLLDASLQSLVTVEFACSDTQALHCSLDYPVRVTLPLSQFITGSWRGNVLTELLYRKLEYPILAGYPAATVKSELEKLAQSVLNSDGGTPNYNDVLAWSGNANALSHPQVVNEFSGLLSEPDAQAELQNALSKSMSAVKSTTSISSGDHQQLALSGNYALVAGASTFQLFDISNIQNPELLFTRPLPNAATDLVVQGDTAYIAREGVTIVDFSNPSSPVVTNYQEPRGLSYRSLAVRNNHIYAVMSGHTVILDAANVNAISEVNDLGRSDDIHIMGNILVIHKPFGESYGFGIYSLDSPEDPVFISDFITYERMWSLSHIGNILYTLQLNGPVLFDLSNANSPQRLPFSTFDPTILSGYADEHYAIFRSNHSTEFFDPSSWERLMLYSTASAEMPQYLGNVVLEDTRIRDVAVKDNNAILLTDLGLEVVDLSLTESSFETGIGLEGLVESVYALNEHLYSARFTEVSDNGPVEGYDVTFLEALALVNPDFPAVVSLPDSNYFIDLHPTGMAAVGSTLYLAGTSLDFYAPSIGGVNTFSLANPGSPVKGQPAFTDYYTRVNKPQLSSGNILLPTYGSVDDDDSLGISIVDVQTPSAPTTLGNVAIPGRTESLAVHNQYVFAASDGIQVVDFSNPVTPVLVSDFNTQDTARDILTKEAGEKSYAYVLEDGLHLSVLDVTDPLNISGASRITYPGTAGLQWILDGHYIYAATKDLQLQVIDIQDPLFPKVMIGPSLRGAARSLAVHGGKLYVGTDYGVEVVEALK